MPRITIGTQPQQILRPNPKRRSWELVFLPSSIDSGNTGLLYIRRGSPPTASLTGFNWDYVINAGSSIGDNLDNLPNAECYKGEVWIVSDTADQDVVIREVNEEG